MAENKLAQPGDRMFERNIGILASRGREICIVNTVGDEHRGFLAGLDDEYIQVCLTDDASLVLVNRSYVVSVEETGYYLDNLDDNETISIVRDKVDNFMNVADRKS